MKSLNNLFTRFPRANYQRLFFKSAGTFSRNYATRKLQEGIHILGYEGEFHLEEGRQHRLDWLGCQGGDATVGNMEVKLLSALCCNSPRLDTQRVPQTSALLTNTTFPPRLSPPPPRPPAQRFHYLVHKLPTPFLPAPDPESHA